MHALLRPTPHPSATLLHLIHWEPPPPPTTPPPHHTPTSKVYPTSPQCTPSPYNPHPAPPYPTPTPPYPHPTGTAPHHICLGPSCMRSWLVTLPCSFSPGHCMHTSQCSLGSPQPMLRNYMRPDLAAVGSCILTVRKVKTLSQHC